MSSDREVYVVAVTSELLRRQRLLPTIRLNLVQGVLQLQKLIRSLSLEEANNLELIAAVWSNGEVSKLRHAQASIGRLSSLCGSQPMS